MKYKIILIFSLFLSCTTNYTKLDNKIPYNAKGFAYIYNEDDFKNKIIKGKLDNSKLQVSHNQLKVNTLIKIINLKTKESLIIKNYKKSNFSDFYKILITEEVANKLNIDKDLPLVEILEIKKNKSFKVKKATITSVTISNISKNRSLKKKEKDEKMYILIASFYSRNTAEFLKKRIIKELPNYDKEKLKILTKKPKEINLISGPYNAVNLMKNDYIQLKKFGFEDLDITLNE